MSSRAAVRLKKARRAGLLWRATRQAAATSTPHRADIARELRTRFEPRPFCSREMVPGCELGEHRVWVDNLPYDATLDDVVEAFGKTCAITAATLYRPQLSAATLQRRRVAEHDALEKQLLQDKCNIARIASVAAMSVADQWGTGKQLPPTGKRRGRPSSAKDDEEVVGLGTGERGRESNRSLEIMRHGDFNALRSFGYLHLASETDRLKALSRSLRIFGVAFHGRPCPTIDESLKRVLYVGGMPPDGDKEAVMALLESRCGHVLASAVDDVHAYHEEGTTKAVKAATVSAELSAQRDLKCTQFLVQVTCPQAGRELLGRLVGDGTSGIFAPLVQGHPVMARWADGLEERYMHATMRTEYELLNDED